jgi:hypothetical protein
MSVSFKLLAIADLKTAIASLLERFFVDPEGDRSRKAFCRINKS